MRKIIYLINLYQLTIKRIKFDWKTKIEFDSIIKKLHKSDLDKYIKHAKNADLARAELHTAKEKLIESKIQIYPLPWSKEFQSSINNYYNDNAPQIVIRRLSYLYHKYDLNNHDCFYLVASKILDSAYGDVDKTLALIDTAAKDFRDILN